MTLKGGKKRFCTLTQDHDTPFATPRILYQKPNSLSNFRRDHTNREEPIPSSIRVQECARSPPMKGEDSQWNYALYGGSLPHVCPLSGPF
jgi:hypothetical protein